MESESNFRGNKSWILEPINRSRDGKRNPHLVEDLFLHLPIIHHLLPETTIVRDSGGRVMTGGFTLEAACLLS